MMMRVLLISLFLQGCGSQRVVESTAPISKQPDLGNTDFKNVQAITNQYCLRCHASSQFLKTEKAWDASEARSRLTARSMPPAGTNESKSLSDVDRSYLISF